MNIQLFAAQFEKNWKLFSKFSQACIVICMILSTLLYFEELRLRSAEPSAFIVIPFALPYLAHTSPPDAPPLWLFETLELQPMWTSTPPPEMLPVPEHLERVPNLQRVAREIFEIERLLNKGRLVWPQHNNAIDRLRKLMGKFPGYPGVSEVHHRAVAMLMTVAADLFEQGYRFEARNLLEEALDIAPDDQRALALQEKFTNAMQKQPGSRVFDGSVSLTTSG